MIATGNRRILPDATTPTASAAADAAAAQVDCSICMAAPREYALLPCGHAYFCETCANGFADEGAECPICRSRVTGAMRIFVEMITAHLGLDVAADGRQAVDYHFRIGLISYLISDGK